MNDLLKGIRVLNPHGITLRSARKMKNLQKAYQSINHRPTGIDEVPYSAVADPIGFLRWGPNFLCQYPELSILKVVQEYLGFGRNPSPTEAIFLEKRVLERSTLEDRIADKAILRKLNPWLGRHLSDRSYAYLPGRSAEDAILKVRSLVRHGRYWALKADFEDFFGSINRGILEIQLRNSISDEALCEAILGSVSPVLSIEGRSFERRNGLPQGSILGPILSNLYMHQFDVACSSCEYLRYADDVLIVSHSEQEAIKSLLFLGRLAARLGLRLNRDKCDVYDLRRESVVFLGYELHGGNIYPPDKAIEQLVKNLIKFRGQPEQSRAVVRTFAHRFRIGPVRKLFRQLDRKLSPLLPPGVRLTVALAEIRQQGQRVHRKERKIQLKPPDGQGCHPTAEKAKLAGPRSRAAGGNGSIRTVAPRLEGHCKGGPFV